VRSLAFLSRIISHPLLLLVLGFVLTGIVGSYLSTKWQAYQWLKQQEYSARQSDIAARQQLAERTLTAVATNIAAANDILTLYDWDFKGPTGEAKEVQKRIANWTEQTKKWNVDYKVLQDQLAGTFREPAISKVFEAIVSASGEVTRRMSNLLAQNGGKRLRKNSDAAFEYRIAVLTNKSINIQMTCLAALMQQSVTHKREIAVLQDKQM
jgi:hypothetical protein